MKSSMKNFLAASLGQFDNTKLSYLKSKNTGLFSVCLYAVRKETFNASGKQYQKDISRFPLTINEEIT